MDKSEVDERHSIGAGPDPLRILLVVNLAWDPHLGAVRVFMELAEQWRAAGHTVETYSVADAFGAGRSWPALTALRQLLFGYKAAAFVRKNRGRFDVIDALIGSLHGSKKSLRMSGLLVARSVGLYLLYERFDQEARRRRPETRGRIITGVFYDAVNRWFRCLSNAAVRRADLINVPNEEERQCLQNEGVSQFSITVQPYGLSPERREALDQAAAPAETRLPLGRVSFLGMWSPRKGSRDWSNIVRLVWQQIPEAHFCFLGTMVEPDKVLQDLGLKSSERIEVLPQYAQEDLPALLGPCAVGAFPSFVEGFGIAVLEQLAAGIPTVAFDVAGPRDMLRHISPDLLVPVGDVQKFADALIRILRSDLTVYRGLSGRCKEGSVSFDWTTIARDTADTYRTRLGKMPLTRGTNHAA